MINSKLIVYDDDDEFRRSAERLINPYKNGSKVPLRLESHLQGKKMETRGEFERFPLKKWRKSRFFSQITLWRYR